MTSATTLPPETEVWSRTDAELVADVAATLALRAQIDGLLLTQLAEVDSRGDPGPAGLPDDPGLAALGAPDRTGRGQLTGQDRDRAARRPPRGGCGARGR